MMSFDVGWPNRHALVAKSTYISGSSQDTLLFEGRCIIGNVKMERTIFTRFDMHDLVERDSLNVYFFAWVYTLFYSFC